MIPASQCSTTQFLGPGRYHISKRASQNTFIAGYKAMGQQGKDLSNPNSTIDFLGSQAAIPLLGEFPHLKHPKTGHDVV